jgi:hypothetical protein
LLIHFNFINTGSFMRKIMASLIVAGSLCGCGSPDSKLDADRILRMAGDEAGLITAPKDKLTRQLNIANREAQTGKPAEARATLAMARQTLENAEKNAFNDQQRLAGWISLCELSRRSDDKAFANSALDQALRTLNELTPQQARCEYVLGVEREVRELRGDAEAAKLLATAGDWAMALLEPSTRRAAFLDYAGELFECNDYEGARTLLRKDQDAAWRSDSLMAISDRARNSNRGSWFGLETTGLYDQTEMARTQSPAAPPKSIPFSKRLDFETNYQQR